MRKNFLFLCGALTGTCLTLLVTGPQSGHLIQAAKAAASAADTYSQLNLFGEVFERVRADYVEKPDDTKLMEGAIDGMVTSLDPHSRYMNDKAWREMQETTSGEFGGLGIEVTMEDGLVKVVSPIDDTPAAKAGIMSGDLISQIDGDAVQGLSLEQAVNKMKGAVDTKTKLTILRKGKDAPFDVSITREIIHGDQADPAARTGRFDRGWPGDPQQPELADGCCLEIGHRRAVPECSAAVRILARHPRQARFWHPTVDMAGRLGRSAWQGACRSALKKPESYCDFRL